MNTSISVPETRRHASPPDPRRAVLANILINVVAPVALYYGLRAVGCDQWLALFLGIVPPAARAVWSVVTLRRVDMLGVLTLSILALVVGVSFLTGSPRFMLAKDGGITAIVGLGFCATLLRTPAYFQLSRAMTRGEIHERIETGWLRSPAFRRSMRIATAIWGIGLVLDAVVRVVFAYTLPVDTVPLLNGLQYIVVIVVLEAGSLAAVRNSRVRARIAAEIGQE
ncbi:VC0807 family protein [Nocardia terpenica]|uniref:VC0807 family protein n=1 Tax=Nocardia terpenica TaxID=455432 RepID=UPI0012FE18D2|nr:VC0807 family protein [Nocardia terpenica]